MLLFQLYTDYINVENEGINLESENPKQIQKIVNEEIKQSSLRNNQFGTDGNYSRPITELSINFVESQLPSVEISSKDCDVISKVKDIIKNRRKYNAS